MSSLPDITGDLLIIGAGGHGAVVLDILRTAGIHEPAGFIDADPALAGTEIAGLPVLGPMNLLPKLRQKIRRAIVAIGDNRMRRSCAVRLAREGFELVNAVHPGAIVSAMAVIGHNVVVAAGAIISTGSRVADSVIVNTGAIVDHECDIAEGAHLGPGCKLAGRVRIAPGAFVGIGASIIQCLTIGEDAVVGAGAVVLKDVAAGDTVVGVPARVLYRPLIKVPA